MWRRRCSTGSSSDAFATTGAQRRGEPRRAQRAPVETERVASETIGAAIDVHRHLGSGFLEKIYQEALCLELSSRGIDYEREKVITVNYKGIAIPGQRVDLIVSGCVLVELKAAIALHVIHVFVVHPVFVLLVVRVTARAS